MAVAVRKVKGVSFNWLQFLWSNIGSIRKAQIEGNIAGALKQTITLIRYLPKDLQEEFLKKAKVMDESISRIVSGNLPVLQATTDLFIRNLKRDRLLVNYSTLAFDKFIGDLILELNARGYMESVEFVDEGFGTSIREHEKQFGAQRGSKKKR